MKKTKWVLPVAYLYILLPFIIFALGWMKWFLSVPLVAALAFVFFYLCRHSDGIWCPNFVSRKDLVKIIWIVVMIFIWVWLSGIGRYAFQNGDHYVRNTMFDMLVNRPWPLIDYDFVSPAGDAAPRAMIYYIGFWLPAAAVAKIFHSLSFGYFFQLIWALIGVLLVYFLICAKGKKLAVWPLLILIFFSGLDFFEQLYLRNYPALLDWTAQLELIRDGWSDATGFAVNYQYSSNTTQLFWVFNQAIPAWLCTALIYTADDNRAIVFVLACSMLTSTLPFIGLLALVIYLVFSQKWQHTFTLPNVLGGGLVGIISFLYLSGNDSGGNSGAFPWYQYLNILLCFLVCEVFVYAIFLWKYNKKNGMFYFLLVSLCVIPLIRIGSSMDFCMRVSIPALFILMLLVIEALRTAWQKKDRIIFFGLLAVLLLGSVTPIHELWRSVHGTYACLRDGTPFYPPSATEYEVISWPNFSGKSEDSFFFRYLAQSK